MCTMPKKQLHMSKPVHFPRSFRSRRFKNESWLLIFIRLTFNFYQVEEMSCGTEQIASTLVFRREKFSWLACVKFMNSKAYELGFFIILIMQLGSFLASLWIIRGVIGAIFGSIVRINQPPNSLKSVEHIENVCYKAPSN